MSDVDAAVRGVLAVPLHQHLGVHLLDDAEPAAGLRLTVGPAAVNNTGVLHGGVLPMLLDVACYLAVLPQLGDGENAVTHATTATLIRPVERDAVVEVRGRVLRRGRSLVFCSAEATVEGRIVAAGQVTKSVVRMP
jgi:uncharacterized protein (TIGR00369 family)